MELRTIRPEIEIKASEEAARLRGILRTKEHQLDEADQDNSELRPLRGVVKSLKRKDLKATVFAAVMVSALRIRKSNWISLPGKTKSLKCGSTAFRPRTMTSRSRTTSLKMKTASLGRSLGSRRHNHVKSAK
jgi:hypothetical protein